MHYSYALFEVGAGPQHRHRSDHLQWCGRYAHPDVPDRKGVEYRGRWLEYRDSSCHEGHGLKSERHASALSHQ